MHVGLVGVVDGDDEPVARVDLDGVGGEPHVLGLDGDLDGLTGRGDAVGRRLRRASEAGRVDRPARGHGHEHQRRADGREPGTLTSRALGGGQRRVVRVGDALLAAPDRAQQQRDECRERAEHERRGKHPDQAGHGQHAHQQPGVGEHDPQRPARVEVAVHRAHLRGPAAHHDRHEVAQRPEQHLRDEARCEVGHECVERLARVHPRVGQRHLDRERDEQPGEPHQPRRHGPGRERRRVLAPGRARERGAEPGHAGGVQDEAEGDESGYVDPGGGHDHADAAGESDQRLARAALGALDDPGAQHGRAERDQRAEHRQPDPAEQVDRDVRESQTRLSGSPGSRASQVPRTTPTGNRQPATT